MSFDELLFQLENAKSIPAKRRRVREFARANTAPLIEDTRATFFYLSEDAQSVAREGDWTHWQPTAPVAAQRRFAQLLRAKGYATASAVYPEGQQWGFWRAHLGEMFKFFWGK